MFHSDFMDKLKKCYTLRTQDTYIYVEGSLEDYLSNYPFLISYRNNSNWVADGLSVMGVGMLSASYLPSRFCALNVSSLSFVISHSWIWNLRRDRMATYVICHSQCSLPCPYVICHHSHFGLLQVENIFAMLSYF